jgi:hypothetical protein
VQNIFYEAAEAVYDDVGVELKTLEDELAERTPKIVRLQL